MTRSLRRLVAQLPAVKRPELPEAARCQLEQVAETARAQLNANDVEGALRAFSGL